jgi:hypothetical protein
MYASARQRAFYGAGDWQKHMVRAHVGMRRKGYAPGFYAAGGFFSSLGKLAKKGLGAVSAAAKIPILGAALKAIPGVGGAITLAETASSLANKFLPSSPVGKTAGATQNLGIQLAGGATKAAGALSLNPFTSKTDIYGKKTKSLDERADEITRALYPGSKPAKKARKKSTRGWHNPRRRKKYAQVNAHLARIGRRKKRKGGSRRRGQRVSFTTKGGKRVSFTAR